VVKVMEELNERSVAFHKRCLNEVSLQERVLLVVARLVGKGVEVAVVTKRRTADIIEVNMLAAVS